MNNICLEFVLNIVERMYVCYYLRYSRKTVQTGPGYGGDKTKSGEISRSLEFSGYANACSASSELEAITMLIQTSGTVHAGVRKAETIKIINNRE